MVEREWRMASVLAVALAVVIAISATCAGCITGEVKEKVELFRGISDGAVRVATVGVVMENGQTRPATYGELVDLLLVQQFSWWSVGFALDLNEPPVEPKLTTLGMAPPPAEDKIGPGAPADSGVAPVESR